MHRKLKKMSRLRRPIFDESTRPGCSKSPIDQPGRFPARSSPPRARRTSPALPAGIPPSSRVVAPALRPWFPLSTPIFPLFSPICGTITTTDGASDGTNLVAGARNLHPRRAPPRARRRLGVPGARVERLGRSCRPRSPALPKAAQNRRTRRAPPEAPPAAPNPGRRRILRG